MWCNSITGCWRAEMSPWTCNNCSKFSLWQITADPRLRFATKLSLSSTFHQTLRHNRSQRRAASEPVRYLSIQESPEALGIYSRVTRIRWPQLCVTCPRVCTSSTTSTAGGQRSHPDNFTCTRAQRGPFIVSGIYSYSTLCFPVPWKPHPAETVRTEEPAHAILSKMEFVEHP